ncbi:MAG: PD-(D/E)XK nuclease family protein [Solirubrobacteraceae bacterium]
MGITLVTGPANAGKAHVVMAAVRAHQARREEPLLIVPTRTDVEHYLRELAGGEVAMGVRVERFAGLIAEVLNRARLERQQLGALARERVIATLQAVGPDRGPGFVRALGELLGELQSLRVTPQRLASALEAGLGDGAEALGLDLAAVYGEYRRRLERLGRLDEEQQTLQALDRLREQPALWGSTPVLFYGFDDLTRQQLDAIETLGRVVDADVTVSLAYEPGRIALAGRAGTFQTLLPMAREHRMLPPRAEYYAAASRPALSHLERSLFEPSSRRVDPAGAIELIQGGGQRAELELIATRVSKLLAEGMAPHEIALVVRRPAASAALVGEVFADASIPFAMPLERPFGDTAVGGALIALLRCVPAPAGAGPPPGSAADLIAWLRAPGLLRRVALADGLERDVRRHGLRTAAQARARWEERHFPLETIDHLAAAQGRGPAALAERASRELAWLFMAPRRGTASVLGDAEMDEARALAGGRAALAELRELAVSDPAAAPASAAELARVLSTLEINSGQLPGPGRVAVLEPLQMRARRVRALFLSGLQEGDFPLRARPEPLLGEHDRTRIAKASGLRLGEREDTLAAERYLLYALLSRPEQRLVLSWHEADDDGGPVARSLFVEDVCDLFEESLSTSRASRGLGALDTGGARRPMEPPLDGRLSDERILSALRERPWSGTGIERWIGCPVAWFVERLLRPEAFEPDPEPLVRGGLAHLVLKETLEQLRAETGSARVTPPSLARARTLMNESLARAETDPRHRVSVTPERAVAIRRALQADLERYLEHAAGLQCALEPRELELAFGFDREEEDHGEPGELPAFELGGGVRLRGRIDRIDVGENGEAIVVDYKAKAASGREKWISERKLQVALYMLAAEQLLGLRVVGGLYQPLGGRDIRARGAVLADLGLAGDCVKTDPLAQDELDELLAEALDAARAAVEEAGRGRLEPRPESCSFGGRGCQYPTICRCER